MAGVSLSVLDFHRTYGVPIRDEPTACIPEAGLRIELLLEEFNEYTAATAAQDIVEIADALADMVYVIYGTALAHGIDLDAVIQEVHRSNMSKLGLNGEVLLRHDGKILKGPNYSPPNIRRVLEEQE